MFTVYLATDSEKPSRVGELDEGEMVYESRPGDVIPPGATSWRITEITHDRVLVVPCPAAPSGGATKRDDPPNPARPSWEFHRRAGGPGSLIVRPKAMCRAGFADYATQNLWQLFDDQRTASMLSCSEATPWWNASRRASGDWRLILHSRTASK